ncbi:Sjoegren syndrome nuclear autoantigen 1 [Geodia barretti]|uniref:Sjoegren syndrome nuclear autoantigen 1 n=1 Tax=Geodia barretti TaxID=519541 RepID=A0AA35R1T8_GEOBA|nr:Sjoegren syndrome nuclear autoantigen 1 [Geodia barretti]
MSQQGAQLQGYNNELIKCIEGPECEARRAPQADLAEEEEKQRVQHDLHIITERLAAINESLARKMPSGTTMTAPSQRRRALTKRFWRAPSHCSTC